MKLRTKLLLCLLLLTAVPQLTYSSDNTCPSCGATVTSENFCGQCGSRIDRPVLEAPVIKNLNQAESTAPGALDPSVQQLIGQLSDQDLRRIVAVMLQRIESRQERFAPDPNSVATMSRQELEYMLQRCADRQVPPPKASAFGAFLQFVGGAVLFILAITIIASL